MAKATGLYISTEGLTELREFTVGQSYEVIKSAVNGYIECAVVQEEIDLWLNEEGKLIGLEINPIATALFWDRYGVGTDVIVGDVFLANHNGEGETVGLTDKQMSYLEEMGLVG